MNIDALLREIEIAKVTGDTSRAAELVNQWLEVNQVARKPSWGAGMARSVLGQGLALGFGDELEAAARAAFSPASYRAERDRIRQEQNAWSAENPVQDLGGQLLGGFMTGGLGAARVGGATGLRAAGRMAGFGAGYGAVGGAGAAEELGDVPLGAAEGAGIGAVLGPAVGMPLEYGAKAVGRAFSSAPRTFDRFSGGRSADDIAGRMEAMGPDTAVMTTDPSLRALTATLYEKPGPQKAQIEDFLRSRQMRQPERISDVVEDVTGIHETAPEAGRRLRETRRMQANENYEQALGGRAVRPTEEMASMVQSEPALLRSAARDYMRRLRMNGQEFNEATVWEDPLFWNSVLTQAEQMGQVAARRGAARDSAWWSTFERKLTEGEQGLYAQLPGYRESREAWARGTRAMEAVTEGEKLASMPTSHFVDMAQGLSIAEREAMAVGLVDSLLNKMLKAPETANQAHNLIKSADTKVKLTTLVGPEKARGLIRRMQDEAEKTIDYNEITQGSKTARQLAAHQTAGDEAAAGAAETLARGENPISAVLNTGARWLGNAVRTGRISEEDAQRLTRILTETDPDTARRLVGDLMTERVPLDQIIYAARRSALGAAGVLQ